jgi:hypothetical protein
MFEVWKFLLGYYRWNATRIEIKIKFRNLKEKDYFDMKLQWKLVSDGSQSGVSPSSRKQRI